MTWGGCVTGNGLSRNDNGSRDASNTAPIRVFTVSDHRMVLWGLEKLINSERPRMEVVGSTTSHADAVALAARLQPDVVLLDLAPGDENGVHLIAQFMASCNAVVLVIAGLRDANVQDRAVLAGARGVVPKESAVELIPKAIETVNRGELWLERSALGRLLERITR